MSSLSHKEDDSISERQYSSKEDRKLVWKVDLYLLPILTLLFLLSFLDRTNIGNAKFGNGAISFIAPQDLNISASDYNTALAIYFVAYVVHEVPANLLLILMHSLKRLNPAIWLPSLTLVWGIVAVCQGLVTNRAGLYGIRYLLGATEAGLFPGAIYVFSIFYRRHERSWRVSILFGGAALAGAFGGVFAYAIGKMNGVGGKEGWRWIFILEGIITVAVSIIAYFIVPTWPHKTSFLTEPEKAQLLNRLKSDSDSADQEPFQWQYVRQALMDHLVWAYAFLYHGFSFVLYSLSLFMPTIIANMGFQSWQAQLMTVPPNTAACLSIWLIVWLSSRIDKRAPFILGSAVVAIIGYIIILTAKTAGGQYVGVHFAAMGIYMGNSLLFSWPSENVSGQTKRAVAIALQIGMGDTGAIAGVLIYRPSLEAHNYRKAHAIAIGYLLFAMIATAYLWFCMRRANAERELQLQNADKNELNELAELTVRQQQGDRNIYYRYVL
ncbi:major facilitator superfamily domain-containing protein [Amanita rubescens]|nr:major facilitator superfamily domain-containing protein [Amanita rubescens]